MAGLLTPEIKAWIGRSEPPIRAEATPREIKKHATASEQRQRRYLDGDEAPPMRLSGLCGGEVTAVDPAARTVRLPRLFVRDEAGEVTSPGSAVVRLPA